MTETGTSTDETHRQLPGDLEDTEKKALLNHSLWVVAQCFSAFRCLLRHTTQEFTFLELGQLQRAHSVGVSQWKEVTATRPWTPRE